MSQSPEFNRNNPHLKVKWFDDITKDSKFYGVGTVNNQTHYPNGAKVEAPFEDRSFAYEFKDNEIYAYGLLDGYNGIWAIDIVEQCVLTNMYFDYLFSLQNMSDEDIFEVLDEEFQKTEQTLRDNQQESLMERSLLSIDAAELKKGTFEYVSMTNKKKQLDKQLDSGTFAIIALIVDKRLFVANVGTSHCFIFKYDERNNEKQVVSVETEHKLNNYQEMLRLKRLNVSFDGTNIEYTRCLGDFKLKLYYSEYPQFKNCTGPPLICKPSHPLSSINIDDSFLFMVMYPEGLAKVVEEIDLSGENTDAKIAKIVIEKILNEQTLNSASQAVLDELKRAYDDKFASRYRERGDLTLIIRIFDSNIKNRLLNIEKLVERNSRSTNNFNSSLFRSTLCETIIDIDNIEDEIDDNFLSTTRITDQDDVSVTSEHVKNKNSILDLINENNCVIPYINLEIEFDKLMLDEENGHVFDEFEQQLTQLENLDLTATKKGHELEVVKEEN